MTPVFVVTVGDVVNVMLVALVAEFFTWIWLDDTYRAWKRRNKK